MRICIDNKHVFIKKTRENYKISETLAISNGENILLSQGLQQRRDFELTRL